MATPMSIGSAAGQYDRWHSELPVDDGSSTPWHQLANQLLEPQRDLIGRATLEIGCGRGGFAASLCRRGAKVTACDFSSTALELARAEFNGLDVEWILADIQKLPFLDSSFDTVISCETIEHVPSPSKAVAELARVLHPGGRLILTTPNYLGSLGLYRAYLRLRGRPFTEAGQPINQFTMAPRTFYWLHRAGLRLEQTLGAGHYLPIPGTPPVRIKPLDRVPGMKVFALHTAFRARKPEP
jgi:2-polyprenyl-3-methyl-5-hydroxy-6-metoxy-1,4-benzoquinol methylase